VSTAKPPEQEASLPTRRGSVGGRLRWPWLCGLVGRLMVLGCLVYVLGGALWALGHLAVHALSGSQPEPQEVADPVQHALARGKAVLPFLAAGLLVALLGGVASFVQRRRTTRGMPGNARGDRGPAD